MLKKKQMLKSNENEFCLFTIEIHFLDVHTYIYKLITKYIKYQEFFSFFFLLMLNHIIHIICFVKQ